jgi:hypothetical protein
MAPEWEIVCSSVIVTCIEKAAGIVALRPPGSKYLVLKGWIRQTR